MSRIALITGATGQDGVGFASHLARAPPGSAAGRSLWACPSERPRDGETDDARTDHETLDRFHFFNSFGALPKTPPRSDRRESGRPWPLCCVPDGQDRRTPSRWRGGSEALNLRRRQPRLRRARVLKPIRDHVRPEGARFSPKKWPTTALAPAVHVNRRRMAAGAFLPNQGAYARLGVACDTPKFCPRFDPILFSAEPDFFRFRLAPALVGSTPFPIGSAQ